jgi:hypothetical protein
LVPLEVPALYQASHPVPTLEPSGLSYAYTVDKGDARTGTVVFVPWKALDRMLR